MTNVIVFLLNKRLYILNLLNSSNTESNKLLSVNIGFHFSPKRMTLKLGTENDQLRTNNGWFI